MLISLANGILENRHPSVSKIRESMIGKIGATLLRSVTPRLLTADASDSVSFISKDASSPDIYMATPELFFGSIASGKMLAFDVHDVAQHATQLKPGLMLHKPSQPPPTAPLPISHSMTTKRCFKNVLHHSHGTLASRNQF